jgi:hypothetical protein
MSSERLEPGHRRRVEEVLEWAQGDLPMNLFTKAVIWVVLSSFVAVGAKARDENSKDVQAARLVICDSAEKAQHFAAQHHDLQAVIADNNATNKDASGAPNTCLVARIAYISGKQMDRVQNKYGPYDVTEILIVGVATPYGLLAIEPAVVYTLLKVDEDAA